MQIPDLTGRSVLDIGAYDGFYSFESERRGAERVVAADSWSWNWPGSDARRNFELAHEVLDSKVESRVVLVEDVSPETVGGVYDVVLFLGVLYHAPDPLGYLRNVRSVTGEVAVVETVIDLLDVDVPAAAYYPSDSLNNDGSNFFGPNPAAVEGMLLDAGFAEGHPVRSVVDQHLVLDRSAQRWRHGRGRQGASPRRAAVRQGPQRPHGLPRRTAS